jgi:hypothetical protein
MGGFPHTTGPGRILFRRINDLPPGGDVAPDA